MYEFDIDSLQVFILFFCPTNKLTITRDGVMGNKKIFYWDGLSSQYITV